MLYVQCRDCVVILGLNASFTREKNQANLSETVNEDLKATFCKFGLWRSIIPKYNVSVDQEVDENDETSDPE